MMPFLSRSLDSATRMPPRALAPKDLSTDPKCHQTAGKASKPSRDPCHQRPGAT